MINIGLIGCGYISYYYCISFTNYDNIHLVGVYDRNKDKRDKLSDKFGCKSFNTLDELLSAKNVHMIINLTNPKAHFELNQKILCAGKHLYCEKPISLSLQDFDILTELSQKHNDQIFHRPCKLHLVNHNSLERMMDIQNFQQAHQAFFQDLLRGQHNHECTE